MLQKQSVSDLIVKDIKSDILNKKLLPGDKLPTERELAEKYELSRIPVREALKTLAQMGLVVTKHGKGTFVRQPDASPIVDNLLQPILTSGQALEDLASLRKIIETQAAKEAAQNCTPEDLAEISRLKDACQKEIDCVLKGLPSTFQQADYLFHLAIAKASKNTIYKSFIETIEKSLRLHQSYSMRNTADAMTKTSHWHEAVTKAIAAKDPALAASAMDSHLTFVVNLIKDRVN